MSRAALVGIVLVGMVACGATASAPPEAAVRVAPSAPPTAAAPSSQRRSTAASDAPDAGATGLDEAAILDCQMYMTSGIGAPPPGCTLDRSDIPPVDLSVLGDAGVVDAAPPPPARGQVALKGRSDPPIADFDRVLAGMRVRVRSCYRKALPEKPKLKGDLALRLQIEPNGEVAKVAIVRHAGFPEEIEACITRAVGNAIFAAPGGKGSSATVEGHFTPD